MFEARDAIGMVWALKVGHPVHTNDQTALARFVREAQWVNTTLGALPRNCGILVGEHYGVYEQRFYVKMRLIDGESLAQRLRRDDALSVQEAVGLARRIAEIVASAHQSNAIHRDLKPENVLLEAQGDIQVVDWGCVHLVEAGQLAQSGTGPLCTAGYAAPEQYDLENPPTPATDIYALGVMLLEMLTGYNPFLDSWRNTARAVTRPVNDVGMTRTGGPHGEDTRAVTGLYPTAHAGNVREASPDAITRSTAATNVVPLEECLADFPEPPRSDFELNDADSFRPLSLAEVLGRQLSFDLGQFRTLTEPLPRRLVDLLDTMLKARASERPASMTDVVTKLSLIAGELQGKDSDVVVKPKDRNRWWQGALLVAATAMAGAAADWWIANVDADAAARSSTPTEEPRDNTPASNSAPLPANVPPVLEVTAKEASLEPSPTVLDDTTLDEGAATPRSSEASTSAEPSAQGTTTPRIREKRDSRAAKDERRPASTRKGSAFADLPYFESQRKSSQ